MELQILDWIGNLHTPILDRLMIAITSLGNGGIFWIILAVIFLFSKRTRVWGLSMGFAMLLGLIVVNFGVKPLVHRMRPYDAAGVEILIERQKDYSFPSGHTQISFACAFILYKMNQKVGAAALILAGVIAFSRMYLYVHYPSDIAVGFLFGCLWAWISVHFFLPWAEKRCNCRPAVSNER